MKPVVRAHRILIPLPNYRRASGTEDALPINASGELGKPVGYYRNPGERGPCIGVFSHGLAWNEQGRLLEIRFEDLAGVSLPEGKESRGLTLRLRNGRQIHLPIQGQRGHFFDSMEMLRFLDRVMKDISKKAKSPPP